MQETNPSESGPAHELSFGRFRLLPQQRTLLDGAEPVRLGGRAFDLLLALVQRAGEVVSREELEARVWQKTVVEETSLRVHISALRKALGEAEGGRRFIVNVPGRGYSFVAPVARRQAAPALPPSVPASAHAGSLPARLTRMIGRASAVTALCELLVQRRLVTIAGPGGMGKTTLAIAVAEQLLPSFPEGACFVDLAPVASPALVPVAIATALGTPAASQDPVTTLMAYLGSRRMLLVLDNCEHVIEMAAAMSEALLRQSPATVLTTSREPLSAEGEWVYRLAPLPTPDAGQVQTARDAAAYPSIDLFIDCARKHDEPFTVSDHSAPLLAEICRRLDGIPLAIELAAAHVQYLGVTELASRLDDRFTLLTRGRRTAPPRQRTLAAMLDWSYELLSPLEQRVVARLATFRSSFSMDSGLAVAVAPPDADVAAVMEALMGLVAKSLIVADPTGPVVRYRLLETTRTYALAKLEPAGEFDSTSRRHALHAQQLLVQAESQWAEMTPARWRAHYGHGMDDIRGALDWCFSATGDVLLGIELSAAAILPMYELGFLHLNEYLQLVQRALAGLQALAAPQPGLEMRLNAALCLRNWSADGAAGLAGVVRRTLALAGQEGETRHRVAALYGVWVSALGVGDYLLSRQAAQRIGALAQEAGDDAAALLRDRITMLTEHFLGEHGTARALAERQAPPAQRRMPLGYSSPIPLAVLQQVVLARVCCLQGSFDRAVDLARACVEAGARAHPIAHIQALAVAAIPIAFWRGDRDSAVALLARLGEVADRHASGYWQSFGRCFEAAIRARGWGPDGLPGPAAPTLHAANALEADCLGTLVDGWFTTEALARAEGGEAGWCAPEILRNVGESLGAAGDLAGAEARFRAAFDLAGRQGALAWQLRSASSLARLWAGQGRVAEARHLLAGVHGQLHEGQATADMRAARQLLVQFGAG